MTNCLTCTSSNKCSECLYKKYRFETNTIKTFYDFLKLETLDCSASTARSGSLTLVYYLRPLGTACTTNPCGNTASDYSTYFDSFYNILKDVIDLI